MSRTKYIFLNMSDVTSSLEENVYVVYQSFADFIINANNLYVTKNPSTFIEGL